MAYEVTYSAGADCVSASIDGIVDLIVAQQYAQEIIRQLSEHNCLRLLNDMRRASIRMSTVDLYELPAWIEEAGVNRSCRRRWSLRGTSATTGSTRRFLAITATCWRCSRIRASPASSGTKPEPASGSP